MIGWSARARLRRRSRAAGITTHPCSIRVAQSDRSTQMKALPACLPTSFLTQALGVRSSHVSRGAHTKANKPLPHTSDGRSAVRSQTGSQSVISRSRPAFTPPPARSPAPVRSQLFANRIRVRGWGTCMGTVSFHGPTPRSPLHRLSIRLRRSRSTTSTEYSLPGATQLSQVRSVSPSEQGDPSCR